MLVYVLLVVLVLALTFWGFRSARRLVKRNEAAARKAAQDAAHEAEPESLPAEPESDLPPLDFERASLPVPLPDFEAAPTAPLPLDALTLPGEAEPQPQPVAPDSVSFVDLELDVVLAPEVPAIEVLEPSAETPVEATEVDLELDLGSAPEPEPEPVLPLPEIEAERFPELVAVAEPEPEPVIEAEAPLPVPELVEVAQPVPEPEPEPVPTPVQPSEPVPAPVPLPAAPPPAPAAPSAPVTPVIPPVAVAASTELPLILVVDDSAVVRAKMIKLLKSVNCRIEIAKNGVQALELIPQLQPQVVITDIEMPEMDGYELIARLDADAALRTIPVCAVSSFENLAERLAPHANVRGCFGKPWDDALVLSTLASLLAASSAKS